MIVQIGLFMSHAWILQVFTIYIKLFVLYHIRHAFVISFLSNPVSFLIMYQMADQ